MPPAENHVIGTTRDAVLIGKITKHAQQLSLAADSFLLVLCRFVGCVLLETAFRRSAERTHPCGPCENEFNTTSCRVSNWGLIQANLVQIC